jgi:hypothetical protein
MSIFRAVDGDVLADMTPREFVFSRDIAHEQGIDLGVTLLGAQENDPPVVMMLELPPGYVLQRHAHPTHRAEVVVRGSIVLEDGRVLYPGDVSTSEPGMFYGPITAGPEGSLTAEIFGTASGLPPVSDESNDEFTRKKTSTIAERTRRNLNL